MLPKMLLLTVLVSGLIHADIVIDGAIDDWGLTQRLNFPEDLPLTLAQDDLFYAQYSNASEPMYHFAIARQPGKVIGENTTLWLNTDNNNYTGYRIWDTYSGAEYFINIYADGQPYLYKGEPFGEYVTGPLVHQYNADHSVLEFSLPLSLIGSPTEGISVLADINDETYLPSYYGTGEFVVKNELPATLPARTDFSKRVAIVYSETSKNNFYDVDLPVQKAYSQLFMSVQNQTMMAGIPFDLLTEDDLTDITKLINYDAIVFPSFSHVASDKIDAIRKTLMQAEYQYGIGMITAGDMMTNYQDGSIVEGDAYRTMKLLFGISRIDGSGPVKVSLNAADTSHPAMNTYNAQEAVIQYPYANHWFSYYGPVSSSTQTQPVSVLATQTVEGSMSGTYSAVTATQTGGRNVHFSTLEFMGDTNLLWSALQWVVYGKQAPAALKMGRYNNLFISRNDMDQSQEIDEVRSVEEPLLNLLNTWKSRYNFVGSYFINIGNNPPDQQTDWNYAVPLYRNFIALGNEIGTHSYTHPEDTNPLSPEEIEFQFNQSMNIIGSYLNPTWRDVSSRGAAVPGMPEGIATSQEIIQYLDYLTGGYSSTGAGYPNAFGFLTPESTKVYFSPNMSFDFTLMEYGIPVYDEASGTWYPQKLNATEAEAQWRKEYATLSNHASLPIIHWPWHDYGPTTSTQNATNPYSTTMYTNTIAMAYNDNAEFLTSIDAAKRIEAFKNAKIAINESGDVMTVNVTASNVGKFALDLDLPAGKVIKSIENWYAYDGDKIFLDSDGGEYKVTLGTRADQITKISSLPMRAELITLQGSADNDNLSFTFKGEGTVTVELKNPLLFYRIKGTSYIFPKSLRSITLNFPTYGTHTVEISNRFSWLGLFNSSSLTNSLSSIKGTTLQSIHHR